MTSFCSQIWEDFSDLLTDFKARDFDFLIGSSSPLIFNSWIWILLIRLSRLILFRSIASWIVVTFGLYHTRRLLRIFLTWPEVVQLLLRTWIPYTRTWNLENIVSMFSSSFILNNSYCWTRRFVLAYWTCWFPS